MVDGPAATVVGLTLDQAAGTYGPADELTINVRFSAVVLLEPGPDVPAGAALSDWAPELQLAAGFFPRSARYLAGSGSDTLSFFYVGALRPA